MNPKKFEQTTYSQLGEDINIRRILSSKFKIRSEYKGFYVDVGAFHPFKFSNTYNFYLAGWHGINVEPNPVNFKLISQFRPNDININMGISQQEELLSYHMYDRPAFNTFCEITASELRKRKDLELLEVRKIETTTLSNLLMINAPIQEIDFLSIDTEGFDLKVLSSLDFSKWAPKIICIEENMLQFRAYSESDIYKFLTPLGYQLSSIVAKSVIYTRRAL